ncbi:MAG: UDP-3-O-(3-hydroxymyristoyl)glucosamine N-acyltransferase [Acidobacteria bacterium]|nr:UDP-3-O-(3-hydroxymyristoyl)glucosamine N-acyltransferase [Acidobacteriota bacterium]MCL5287630.1 UDP-3-O-(3-hydroxymyristoyl)glucosamine N-acyltransferase [Acidobacteriota bacterium]
MIRTAREIAEYAGAQLEGDAAAQISGVASPESAGPEDLIYVDTARHWERAAESRARCVLLPPGLELAGRTILRTVQPKLAFAKVAAWLLPPQAIAIGIHPSAIIASTARLGDGVAVGPYAVIEDEVEIGDGTQIGAQCFVGRGAHIGERCRLYPRVTLYAGARLGKNVMVHSGAVIGSDGFGYVFGEGKHWKFPQIGRVEIGDEVEIGSNATIDRGALDTTRIGAGTKIDNLVQIAHNVQVGEHSIIAAQTGISGSSRIGKQVVIGGQVGIADGCHIRDGAIVGAQAGIPTGKTIPAGETVWGTPARPLVKFKEQYAWFARLPELVDRLKKLEQQRG